MRIKLRRGSFVTIHLGLYLAVYLAPHDGCQLISRHNYNNAVYPSHFTAYNL